MPDDAKTWSEIIDRLKTGDEVAASEFYARYGPLLERVAAAQLQSRVLRRVEPGEVAHSVCRTFLRRVQGGGFSLDAGDDMWHLLCAITVAKARKQARFHLAHKRALGREKQPADGAVEDGAVDATAFELADRAPTPLQSAEFIDTFRHLLAQLDDEERRIVGLKLDQRSHAEIAVECGCSERTVRRIVKRLEARLLETAELDAE